MVATTSKTKTKRAMKYEYRAVYLTLAGKNLDPEKISKMLDIAPDSRGKLGELCGRSRKRKQGYWTLEGGPPSRQIETQMKHISNRIDPVKQKLRNLIKEDRTIERAYVTIALEPPKGIANACYCFGAELINRFTSIGVDIALSIYMVEELERVVGNKGQN